MIETDEVPVDLTTKEAAALLACPRQATTREIRRITRWTAKALGPGIERWAASERPDRAARGFADGFRAAAKLAGADFDRYVRIVLHIAEKLVNEDGAGCKTPRS